MHNAYTCKNAYYYFHISGDIVVICKLQKLFYYNGVGKSIGQRIIVTSKSRWKITSFRGYGLRQYNHNRRSATL